MTKGGDEVVLILVTFNDFILLNLCLCIDFMDDGHMYVFLYGTYVGNLISIIALPIKS